MHLNSGDKLGPYEILAPLGSGGMGEVYRARDTRLAREVAIKVLPAAYAGDTERLHRFEQEATATGQLNHPNIIAVFDIGTHEGAPYVVEELLEGQTLRERIGGDPLPARKALDYARQVAEGLAAAHAKGIVHRDLKPENLFVTNDGRVKILDFGLAKLTRRDEAESALTGAVTAVKTQSGVVLGTVGYMSPEQVRGQATDHRSDIFSFGSILYEMLTGRQAFSAGSSVETMNAILKSDPPELSRAGGEIPAGLERIVQHCLEKSPDERFQSARDLAFDLGSMSAGSSSTLAASTAPSARAGSGRRALVRALAGLAILAAIGAAWVAGRGARPETTQPTYSQLTFRRGNVFSARFAADGQTIVYGASWEGDPTRLFTTRPGSPESRQLEGLDAGVLAISSAGEMAILRGWSFIGGWMYTGMLGRASLAGGAPRDVLPGVQYADWSPVKGDLAIVRMQNGRYRLEYPSGTVLYEAAGWISDPRFSRDGTRIAFLDHPGLGDDRGLVSMVDLSGAKRDLTPIWASTSGLGWSPDGAEVWFTAGRTGNVRALHGVDMSGDVRLIVGAPADLVLQDVSANGDVLLTRNTALRGIIGLAPGETRERDLSWLDWSNPCDLSRDGTMMLFNEQGQGGGPGYSVYIRATDGSPAVRLGYGICHALSVDARWAITNTFEELNKVIELPTGPGEPREHELPGLTGFGLAWAIPGDRLLVYGRGPDNPPGMYLVAGRDPASIRAVAPDVVAGGCVPSADGTRLAYKDTQNRIWLAPIEGGERRPVEGALPNEFPVTFDPDGRSLLMGRSTESGLRIDRLDPDTGERALWKTLAPGEPAGVIDVGPVFISADARAYVYSYRRVLGTLYLAQGLR